MSKTVYSLYLAMNVELLLSLASLQNEHYVLTVCIFYSEYYVSKTIYSLYLAMSVELLLSLARFKYVVSS